MKLSRQAIEDFKKIYTEEHGVTVSDEEAEEMALRVLRLFDVLDRSIPCDSSDEVIPH